MSKEQELQKALTAAQDALNAYQSKPAVWVPDMCEYFYVDASGSVWPSRAAGEDLQENIKVGNCYQTKALALKAAEYSKVQGLINQACLNVESDYTPDWYNDNEQKHGVSYCTGLGSWATFHAYWVASSEVYLSTQAKAQQACDILNGIKLKPVGVK